MYNYVVRLACYTIHGHGAIMIIIFKIITIIILDCSWLADIIFRYDSFPEFKLSMFAVETYPAAQGTYYWWKCTDNNVKWNTLFLRLLGNRKGGLTHANLNAHKRMCNHYLGIYLYTLLSKWFLWVIKFNLLVF